MLADSEIERILVIAAHPDDVDLSAAGTIARWTDAGISVVYCIVTDGGAGAKDEGAQPAELARLRRAEQAAAAKQAGVDDIRWLGYPDGRVEPTLALRRDLTRVIRQVRPERVMCPSPERNYARVRVSHPDHRAVGSAALDAVYPDSRNPYAFPELHAHEGLRPWEVREVWMTGGPEPNHYVDVTATFHRKVAAVRAHESQVSHLEKLEELMRGWLTQAAVAGGLPPGRLAEPFTAIDTG